MFIGQFLTNVRKDVLIMTKREAIKLLETQIDDLYSSRTLDPVACDLIMAIDMAISALKTDVAYICNDEECARCGQAFIRECYHTTDIHFARNFEEVAPGVFIEKPHSKE